jgi:hypothetical protein
VRREKAIYHTLNKLSMDTSRKVLLAEAWCPLAAKPHVHEALRRAAVDSSTQVRGCAGSPATVVFWSVQLHWQSQYNCLYRCTVSVSVSVSVVHICSDQLCVSLLPPSMLYSNCVKHAQVSTVLQPLVTDDPPPTYFQTDKFTTCFQVRTSRSASLSAPGRSHRRRYPVHIYLLWPVQLCFL